MGQGGDDFLPRQRTNNGQCTTSDQRGEMGRYVLGGQKTGQKLIEELGVAQGELEDGRRAEDRNGAGQHWRGGEGTAVTGASGDGDSLLGGRAGRGQRGGSCWVSMDKDRESSCRTLTL